MGEARRSVVVRQVPLSTRAAAGAVTRRPPVAVLGMHRSGTSCLAGSLEEAGLHLGSVNTRAPFNARGNRENREIMDLHDAVLAANGGSWDAPPEAVTWDASHRGWRDRIVAGYPAGMSWGFKDPRSLLTLEGWLEAFPDMRMAGTFRHPTAVAASLAHRNRFPAERGYAIWLEYNRRLVHYHQRFGFPLIDFDAPPEKYLVRLRQVTESLGLCEPAGGFAFFEGTLRSNRARHDEDLPSPVAELLALLKELAA